MTKILLRGFLGLVLTLAFAAMSNRAHAGDLPMSEDRAEVVDDELGAWIERNADRYGLYVEPTKPKNTTRKPKETMSIPAIEAKPLDINYDEFAAIVSKMPSLEAPLEAVNAEPAVQVSAVIKDMKLADMCENFAGPRGLGEWGRELVDLVRRGKGSELVAGTSDMDRYCPNYDKLTLTEKGYVLVMLVASKTFLEASCDPRKKTRGPYGMARGLMQLHDGQEDKYATDCVKGDSRTVRGTLRCWLSMMDKQVEVTGKLFTDWSHFGTMRPKGDLIRTKSGPRYIRLSAPIQNSMQRLPLCQRGTTTRYVDKSSDDHSTQSALVGPFRSWQRAPTLR